MDAQDLNSSILQLALQGKLVPQNSNDEPSYILLEKIQKEKEQLIKDKKIKRNNKESIIFRDNGHFYEKKGKKGEPICIDEELPFEIPNSWEWIKLGSLISIITGTSYKKGDICSEGIRILRGGNIQNNKILLLDDDVFLPNSYYNELKEIKKGDVLIVASTGSKKVIGKPGFVKEDYSNISIGAFLRICRPHVNYLADYIQFIFASEYYRRHIRKLSQGTNINNVKKEYIEELYIPLPPLDEQKRIIKEFEKILPLIDEYGVNKEQLDKINSELPVKLKSSILQEAVQGKLVPQNPNDESASTLLENIKKEKEELIKTKKIKRNNKESTIYKENGHYYERIGKKGEPTCIDDEIPFEIPNNWEWCRLGFIGDWGAGATPKRGEPKYYSNGTIPWLKTGDLNNGVINEVPEFITEIALKETSVRLNPIGSVLIAMYGATIGKVGILNIEATTNQACCACLPFNGIYNKYLFYYLMSQNKNFNKMGEGGAQPNISRTKIINYLFPVPPLNEQKRIVEKIEKILAEIEILN